jgi:hypothetical protein
MEPSKIGLVKNIGSIQLPDSSYLFAHWQLSKPYIITHNHAMVSLIILIPWSASLISSSCVVDAAETAINNNHHFITQEGATATNATVHDSVTAVPKPLIQLY